MKCKQCGSEIIEGAKFCEECGAPVPAQKKTAKQKPENPKPEKPAAGKVKQEKPKAEKASAAKAAPVSAPSPVYSNAALRLSQALFPDEPAVSYCGSGAVRQGIPAPGFSDRADDREILKAVNKRRNITRVLACIVIPLPLLGFIIYSLVSHQMELGQAALYGGIISGVFLIVMLFSALKNALKKPYEGTVTDMKSHLEYKNRGSDKEQCYTEYVTYVLTSDGKKKKIKEKEGPGVQAYFYLEIGDRFRYHPRFTFPYEVYDKSKKQSIYCVSCGAENPLEADRCKKCRIPLLK